MTERKSLRLTEKEINIITLALSNQLREIDSHVETLRIVNNFDDATKENEKELVNRMADYFDAKQLRTFLWSVFDSE